jgi:HAD superfamily hydrolase (TIGR01509 family)
MPIEFIYFDLGNVLCRFDHGRACRQVGGLLGVDPSVVRAAVFESGLEDRFEAGDVSEEDLFDAFVPRVLGTSGGREPHPAELARAMGEIFELNAGLLPVIAGLDRAGWPLGVLSNTNSLHWRLGVVPRFRIISTAFRHCVLSYEVRSMKPDRGIFDAAVSRAGVAAERILFFDDRQENVEGARRAGIDAVRYVTPTEVIRELRRRGIVIG